MTTPEQIATYAWAFFALAGLCLPIAAIGLMLLPDTDGKRDKTAMGICMLAFPSLVLMWIVFIIGNLTWGWS